MPDDEGGAPGGVVDEFEDEEFTQRVLRLGAQQAIALGLDGTYRRHQKIVVIGTFNIDEVAHKTVKNAPTRVEVGTATELFIVSDSTDALDLLQRARAERERALDELLGVQRLPLDDERELPPGVELLGPGADDDEFNDKLREILAGDTPDADLADGLGTALDEGDDEVPPPEEP